MKRGKRYKELSKLVDRAVQYDPAEAIDLVQKTAKAKFDETIEMHIRLGVDSRHADQQCAAPLCSPRHRPDQTRPGFRQGPESR